MDAHDISLALDDEDIVPSPAENANGEEEEQSDDTDNAAPAGDEGGSGDDDEGEDEGAELDLEESDESDDPDEDVIDDDESDDEPEEDDEEDGQPQKSRLKDRFRSLTSEKRRMAHELEIERERNKILMEKFKGNNEKGDGDNKPKVDLSKYDPKKLQEVKALMESLGMGDLQQQIASMQSELQKAKKDAETQADQKARQAVVQQYKGIVTEEEIEAQIEEWSTDPDPRVQLRAGLPYKDIVLLMKKDKILEKEVDSTLKKKKKNAPPLSKPESKDKKKPTRTAPRWEPGDYDGSLDALKHHLLSDLVAAE